MAKFPARLPRSRLEKPRSWEPSQPALSYGHIENFKKDLEVRRDLGNRASPVNRAHLKRSSVLCAFCLWIILQSKFFHLLILRKIAFYRVYMGELKIYKYKYRPRSKSI